MSDRVSMLGLRIRAGDQLLVREATLDVHTGEVTALVGASGSGKTLTARALLGLVELEPGVEAADYLLEIDGHTLRPYDQCLGQHRQARERAFAPLRGDVLGYLPQDARAALDPLVRVGTQVAKVAELGGHPLDPLPWLSRAGLDDAERVSELYPHELSGGMVQRVVIAQALARGSRFLIADEPTTGLDPTVQSEILDELQRLVREQGLGLVLITHDLRILPDLADRIVVMRQGEMVEETTVARLRAGALDSPAARDLLTATRRIAAGRLG